ncbi:MAG: GNAT family N-acetyltransferase [Lautropia sp.]|nr:GNAT family N-acetyltransferase [Lautropia sp.]
MADQFRIQALGHTDATAAWQLTQQLRWPHRQEDWAQMIAWANQHGMACGLFHQQQLIGTALCWYWGQTHANLGLMIVDPAWQKRGLGRRLLTHLLDALPQRSISLMATEAGLPLYQQLGFEALGRNTQYQGLFQGQDDDVAGLASPRLATPSDLDAIIALDTRLRGLDRTWLLRELLSRPLDTAPVQSGLPDEVHHLPHLADKPSAPQEGFSTPPPDNACTEACAVLGGPAGTTQAYGVRRRFGRGWLIGPLLAPTEADAIALLSCLCAPLTGTFVRIDLGWQAPARQIAPQILPLNAPDFNTPPAQPAPVAPPSATTEATALGAWLQAHGLHIVDRPLAMQRPGTQAMPAPHTSTAPQFPGFPPAPAVLTLLSQATG